MLVKESNILGKRLRWSRENKELKQNKVASDLSITPYQLSRYESGFSKPDPELIASFAAYYGVTTDYLLGHETKDIDSMTDDEIDEEIKEIMKEVNVWYKDEPENKREKLKMLRKIIKSFTEED